MSYSAQIGLVGALLAVGLAASTPGSQLVSSAEAPVAGALKGQVAALDFAGSRTPERDATVTLAWIPGLSSAARGDIIPILSVSDAKSTSDGRFSLTVPNTDEFMSVAKESGGWLNFILGTQTVSGESRVVDVAWNSKTGVIAPSEHLLVRRVPPCLHCMWATRRLTRACGREIWVKALVLVRSVNSVPPALGRATPHQ